MDTITPFSSAKGILLFQSNLIGMLLRLSLPCHICILNFIHSIHVLAVTAGSLPPLAFNLSPNNKSSSQNQSDQKMIIFHLVSQFLLLYQHIVYKQNFLPELKSTSSYSGIYHVPIYHILYTSPNLPSPSCRTWHMDQLYS